MDQNTDLSMNKKQKSYKLYENIEFTQKESELFDYLINFIKEKKLDLVLRCVGGFVRDKLLQLESEDIDIALDKMTGEQFVLMLKQNFEEKGEHLHNIHIIKSNPEKSKHLETATCNIFGFEVDFVNLRGEEYAQNSRIPTQTTFGSPYEDALRRDLTINALFYNINEEKLEDFTERGLKDLKNGVCMTPMDPLKTFIDDPLRIIRTIRFMSRYNFTIDKTVFETMKLEQVRNALKLKVSPERIGKEITKLLKGNNPYMAIQAIKDSNLWEILAPINEKCEELINDQNATKNCLALSEKLTDSIVNKMDHWNSYKDLYKQFFKQQQYYLIKRNRILMNAKFIAKTWRKILVMRITPLFFIFLPLCIHFNLTHFLEIKKGSQNWLYTIYQLISIDFVKITVELQNKQLSVHIKQMKWQNYSKFPNQIQNKIILYQTKYSQKQGEEISEIFEIPLKKIGPLMRVILFNVSLWQYENQDKSKKELLEYIEQEKDIFLIDNHQI